MSTGSKTVTVYGKPKAQGSVSSFKHPKTGAVITPQDAKVVSYRTLIQEAWRREHGDQPEPLDGPVKVTLHFYFRRPDSHFKPETKARGPRFEYRDSAPRAHIQTPDIDKLARSVLDALTGWAFVDDKQVSYLVVCKWWSRNHDEAIAEVSPL